MLSFIKKHSFKKNSNTTKKIVKGFTMAEMLITISIIGILSMAAQAAYAQSIAKTRDSLRISDLKITKDIISIEMNESDAIFANQAEFAGVLEKYSFHITPQGNTCYFIASIPAEDSPLGHIEYAVVTWGETTSTKNPGKPGLLLIGTKQVTENLLSVALNKGEEDLDSRLGIKDFACGDSIRMQKVEKAFLGDSSFEEA